MNEQEKTRMLEKIVAPLVEWYGINARALPWRMSKAPYGIWVSEIMLQQTRVSAVIEYFKRFMTALPTIEALAEAKEEELLKLWEGLGYYTRVRNLQKAAKVIVQEHQGCFPQTYEAVIALPGIGAYTAGAICSIAFEQKTPAVDGNVLRVMSRLTENYGDIGKASVKKQVEQQLKAIYPEGRCGDFTQSLMELGATICIPKGEPDCGACPVSSFCRGYQNNTYKELPIKAKKIQRRKEKKTVFLLTCGEEYAIEKREKGGLLGGLWAFPSSEGRLDKAELFNWLSAHHLTAEEIGEGRALRHVFTHIEWEMMGYSISCVEKNEEFVWKSRKEIEEGFALPTAFKKFLL